MAVAIPRGGPHPHEAVLHEVLARRRVHDGPDGAAPLEVAGRVRVPRLKGSIGEGTNHSNFSHQSSVKILSKLSAFC